MFGNSGSGGFSFGAKPATTTPTTAGGSGFSFGGASNNNTTSTPAPASSGFSFGAKPAASSTTSTGGGLFGGASNTPAAPASTATGGFGFGTSNNNNTNPATPAPTTGGGFSFGASSNNNPAASTTTAAPSTGGFSFGTSNTASGSTPAATGGLFGSKPAATTGGLFGNNNTSASSTPSGGLFGSSNATSTTAPSGGLFSNNATTTTPSGGLFGNNNPSTTLQQLQQQPQQPQQPQGTAPYNSQPSFAWSSNSQPQQSQQVHPSILLAQQLNQQQNQQTQQPTGGYTPTINDQLTKVKNSWDANSSQCVMKTYLYNKVPAEFNNYERPADELPEDWEKAMKSRPKNYNSIPMKVKGFEDLFKRSNLQIDHIKQSRLLLNQINTNLINLSDKHDLDTLNRLAQCKVKQKLLNLKLLKIAINLTIMKYKGYQLTNDEEHLISKFKELLNSIDDPIGLNRSNELWARLSNLKQRMINVNMNLEKLDASSKERGGSDDASKGISAKNEAVLVKLIKILSKQQQGIQYLYDLIENDKEIVSKLM